MAKEVVGRAVFTKYKAGIDLPIRYGPLNPQNILIDDEADREKTEDAIDQY
ncbi:MAG: hypothetical protein FWG27_03085 [Treponema sp.]|nr:hypothetical protein [Treponema sp.]